MVVLHDETLSANAIGLPRIVGFQFSEYRSPASFLNHRRVVSSRYGSKSMEVFRSILCFL